jgi:betaine-aldehyde dehydrogenase
MTELTIIPASGVALPAEPFRARHLIDGAWTDSGDGATSERHSPAHGDLVSVAARGGMAETQAAIGAARRAFDAGDWSRAPGKDRSKILLKVADLIERDIERIALIETLESGKPISQARSEIEGAADLWRYAAALARTMHGDSHNSLGPDMLGLVLKEPIGVAGDHLPVELPVPHRQPETALRACRRLHGGGEAVRADAIEHGDARELLQEAGVPRGVVNIVLGYGDPVGATLSTHPIGRHGLFHRLDRCGQAHRLGGQRDAEEGQPRAGRQEPAGDLPGCRSGSGGGRDHLRRLFQRGRMLQLRQPDYRT